jgi:hypothetical protein
MNDKIPRMKKQMIIILMCLFAGQLSAQKLVVSYDYLKDDFTYYKVKRGKKKQMDRAVVGRRSDIKVEVKNFNPFVYSASANFISEEKVEEPNISFFSLLSPIPLQASGRSFLEKIETDQNTRGAAVGGLMKDAKVSTAFGSVQQAYASMYEAERTMLNIDYAIQKLQELKYSTFLPADTIKYYTKQLMGIIVQKPEVNTGDFLALGEELSAQIGESKTTFQMAFNQFNNVAENYAMNNGMNATADPAYKISQQFANDAAQFNTYYTDELVNLKLTSLERLYQSIVNTNFNFNASEVSEGDEMTLTIDFYKNKYDEKGEPIIDIENMADLNKIKSKKVRITVKNDIKINSSVGLGFPTYNDNNDFLNKDSVITSVSGNNFTPNIAAYMNFYPYSGRNLNLGGTFGLGVPMGDDVRNLNMFIGFSGIIGSSNKVVLHAGASLGQVNQLDAGFQVGDRLATATESVPVRRSYQWGAFAGISFAIGNIRN